MSTPLFAEALTALIDSRIYGIRVALPASVQSYDASLQRVDVQPLVQDGYYDSTNTRQVDRLPMVTGVPVVFPMGAFGGVTFPVQVGDTVLLVCSSSSLDAWLAGNGGEVDPQDDRRHDLSDAIAIPGLRATPLPSGTTDTAATVVNGATVRLGSSNAAGAVVVQSALDTLGAALVTAITALTAVSPGGAALQALLTALGGSNTGSPAFTPIYLPGTWAAGTAKTKAE